MKAHEILKEHFERKKRKGYSLRALARDLKVSAAFVSNVFQAKKKLPPKMVASFARVLDIDSETVLEIQRQLSPGPVAAFKTPTSRARWKVMNKGGLSALKQWYYLAAMELTLCNDYDGTAGYIARRLDLPLNSIEVALKDLCELGLLKEKNGKVVKPTAHMRMASAQSKQEIRNFHRQMLRKADEELEQSAQENFEKRLITGITVTADSAKIAVAKKMLSDALYEIANFLADGEATEVYHLAAQLIPLTKRP